MSDEMKYWKQGTDVRADDFFTEEGESPEDQGFLEVSLSSLEDEDTVLFGDGTWKLVKTLRGEAAAEEDQKA